MKRLLTLLLCTALFAACKSENKEPEAVPVEEPRQIIEREETEQEIEGLEVHPVSHATLVLEWDDTTIYVDPVGGAAAFSEFEDPDLVLITDIHQDHLDPQTLLGLDLEEAKIVVPQAVKEQLADALKKELIVMNNGESFSTEDLSIKAIPMYNLREEAKQFHPKGRGNGYILERNGQRVYIAGDTEDIPEMRNLQNIDVAFVPMNLPYTMPVEAAADAVIEFAPDQVYPYHFRGQNGKADVQKFQRLVDQANKEIEVVLADWYPDEEQ